MQRILLKIRIHNSTVQVRRERFIFRLSFFLWKLIRMNGEFHRPLYMWYNNVSNRSR